MEANRQYNGLPIIKQTFKIVPSIQKTRTSYNVVKGQPVVVRQSSIPNIAPVPLQSTPKPTFWLTIIEDDVSAHMFGPTPEGENGIETCRKCKEHVLFIYQFSDQSPTLTYIPMTYEKPLADKYVCLDCFRVYCLLSMHRSITLKLPCYSVNQLTPDSDVRTWAHYCGQYDDHFPAIGYSDLYKETFDSIVSPQLVPLLTYPMGKFMSRMGLAHKQLTQFLANNRLPNLHVLLEYLIRTCEMKTEAMARRFLRLFKLSYPMSYAEESSSGYPSVSQLLDEVGDEPSIETRDMIKNKKQFTYEELFSKTTTSSGNQYVEFLGEQKKTNSTCRFVPYTASKNLLTHTIMPTIPLQSKSPASMSNPIGLEQTADMLNELIAKQSTNYGVDEFKAAVKRFRLLVLYYAPKRVPEFERIIAEVMNKLESKSSTDSQRSSISPSTLIDTSK
ncbi:hypothetical protein M3Y98_00639400 [Aphelenchoides besseyi]|nr:hypothetical protein M3Y98_00639400 [Aphelenchoides besseyi]KAI6208553.1 hypothetical protein M3Y96_00127400 [Aphelenchoides besseyi]